MRTRLLRKHIAYIYFLDTPKPVFITLMPILHRHNYADDIEFFGRLIETAFLSSKSSLPRGMYGIVLASDFKLPFLLEDSHPI